MMTGPMTMGGNRRCNQLTPANEMIPATTAYTKPDTTTPPIAYGTPHCSEATMNATGAMNANEEPRYAGTLPPVMTKNRSVPNPEVNKATAGLNPVKIGTRMVAPNMANTCCSANGTILESGSRSST